MSLYPLASSCLPFPFCSASPSSTSSLCYITVTLAASPEFTGFSSRPCFCLCEDIVDFQIWKYWIHHTVEIHHTVLGSCHQHGIHRMEFLASGFNLAHPVPQCQVTAAIWRMNQKTQDSFSFSPLLLPPLLPLPYLSALPLLPPPVPPSIHLSLSFPFPLPVPLTMPFK